MARVRELRADDLPAVVELFERVYPQHRWRSRAACEAYFREMLCESPWRDAGLPSWLAEDNGRPTGLYAVQPRRMRLGERLLRVAVGCQFMVDPGPRRSLVALQLTQACLAGPQDLTLADGANDLMRRMWRGIGGQVPLLHSLHWTRPLRPARHALGLLERRAGALARLARPLAAACDALASRLPPNRFLRGDSSAQDAPLRVEDILALLPEALQDAALRPEYDAAGLRWLLEQAARKSRFGRLRTRLVHEGGRALGWFLAYVRRGAAAEVLQLAARPGAFERVLQSALVYAWREGASALRGRLDARYAQELSQRHCWFRWDGNWTLAHTRDAEIAAALHAGEAFVSRLDGEWWMRFLDEDAPVPAASAALAAPRGRPRAARATGGAT
jgi:hypothetical protein